MILFANRVLLPLVHHRMAGQKVCSSPPGWTSPRPSVFPHVALLSSPNHCKDLLWSQLEYVSSCFFTLFHCVLVLPQEAFELREGGILGRMQRNEELLLAAKGSARALCTAMLAGECGQRTAVFAVNLWRHNFYTTKSLEANLFVKTAKMYLYTG